MEYTIFRNQERKRIIMEDNNIKPSTKREKLENFWYYHKWHTLIAIFLIITVTVCALQLSTKESYDLHIMYAGPREFKRTSSNGDIPEYANALASLKRVASDFDGNGEVSVDFLDLFLLTTDEIVEAEKDEETNVNYALIADNKDKFSNIIMYSDYYVCLISTSLYEQYKVVSGVNLFTSLGKYLDSSQKDSPRVIFYADDAVFLSSTYLASLPVFSNMPEDTLVCLRMKSAISSHFGKEDTEEAYRRSEETIRKILN